MERASFIILFLTGLLVAGLLVLFQRLQPPQLGEAIGAAAALYLFLLIGAAWLRSQHELVDAWMFLLPLSLFQVLPDWMLVRQGLLVFPVLGGAAFGPVPVYMSGLWVAPLLIVVWLAEMAYERSTWLALAVAPLASCVVFGLAEWASVRHGLWLAHNVPTWHGVAPYVLAAETLLGLVTWLTFGWVRRRALPLKIAGAACVSLTYAGALAGAHYAFARWF